jgi:hypothetical protein
MRFSNTNTDTQKNLLSLSELFQKYKTGISAETKGNALHEWTEETFARSFIHKLKPERTVSEIMFEVQEEVGPPARPYIKLFAYFTSQNEKEVRAHCNVYERNGDLSITAVELVNEERASAKK